MNFYSTKNKDYHVDFEEAVIHGLAPDGGLFMPDQTRPLPESFWKDFHSLDFKELSFRLASHFLTGSIAENDLRTIVFNAITFDAPLVKLEGNIYSLELFHGPTLAFKDFGARFLAGLVEYYSLKRKQATTVLVATSGDTGSAVAHAFLGKKNINVVVLYPSGKVSEWQEKQFATLGQNISALEIDGTFDDCQRMVKEAFADARIQATIPLTSANSINIARLLPQMFYYFRAVQQLQSENPIVISVPSGNFGNLTAGILAQRIGLPVHCFIAATNINDVVPEYLMSGKFQPRHSRNTLSNAMDVGSPSNFERLMDLFEGDHNAMRRNIFGLAFTDDETRKAITAVHHEFGYTLDPHGAIGYLGLKKYLLNAPESIGIFLETAHPGKFKDVVENVTGVEVDIPQRLLEVMKRKKDSIKLTNQFESLKTFLLSMV